jgi:hypothetical protein
MLRSRWVPFPESAEAFIRGIVKPDHPLTAREVSAILGIHPNTVKRMPPNELPYFTVGSRGDRRYLASDVKLYIADRQVG